MKNICRILFTVLFFATMPVVLHADIDPFEGFSLTASVAGNYCGYSFGFVPATFPTEPAGVETEIYTGTTTNIVASAELTAAYNWTTKYIGISGFGFQPRRVDGEYEIMRSYPNGQSSSTSGYPFYLDQYMYGAILEMGFCSKSQDWVYASTGSYAKTTYGTARYHFGIGIGGFYRSIKSDVPQLAGSDYGWVGTLRFQYLLIAGFGVELNGKVFFQKPYYDRMTMSAGLGVFYKIF